MSDIPNNENQTAEQNKRDNGQRNRIAYDRLTYYHLNLPLTLLGHYFAALLLGALMYSQTDLPELGAWLVLSTAIFFYRMQRYFHFKNTDEEEKLRLAVAWKWRFHRELLLNGLIWGFSAILLFPEDLTYQYMLIIFLLAVTFTSIGYLAQQIWLLVLYLVVTFLPLMIHLFLFAEPFYHVLMLTVGGLIAFLFLLGVLFETVVSSGLYSHQQFVDIRNAHQSLQERFTALFEQAPIGIVYYDSRLSIIDANQKFLEMNGISSKTSLLDRTFNHKMYIEIHPALKQVFEDIQGKYKGPFKALGTQKILNVELYAVPLVDNEHKILGGIAMFKDETEEIAVKESMIKNAYYDPLTQLPNRTFLIEILYDSVEEAKKSGWYGAIIYLDIDQFKKINETFGHDRGDAVIRQAAQWLGLVTTRADTVARIGGDKFVVLISNLAANKDETYAKAMKTVEKIRESLEAGIFIAGETYQIDASFGIYAFPRTDESGYDALKRAETAMYEAKRRGRKTTVCYSNELERHSQETRELELLLKKAIANNQFELHYQPQVEIATGNVIGAETLLRWKLPDHGFVPPDKFIPIAEESGYIIQIGHWVMEQALRDLKIITSGLDIGHIAINISGLHFARPNFVQEVIKLTKFYDVSPKHIEIEITEGVLLDNIQDAVSKMNKLKQYGFRFAMDDFGTGYSSLSYIAGLPFDTIKIDKTFIDKIASSSRDTMLVKAIIGIAKSFSFKVTAEGVEDESTLQILRQNSCDFYQGYHLSKPLPFKEFIALLETKKISPAYSTSSSSH